MVAIRFISRQADGSTRTDEIDAISGHSLMQAAVSAGIDGIAADCGGSLVCATCHVYVAPEWISKLPDPGAEELGMLDFVTAARGEGSRLSCQIVIAPELEGLTIEVPERQY
jgi:2Fe-2S ferredoxin